MIDMKPAVGRTVFCESVDRDAFVGRHGTIKKISGPRIVWEDPSGKEHHAYKFAAVCDTDYEVSAILSFNSRAVDQTRVLRATLASDWNGLFGAQP